MNEIHNSKLNEIKSVFDDLDQNRNAHDIITRLQSGTSSQLEFARPVIQKGAIAWVSKDNRALKNFDKLDSSKQLEALDILQREMDVFKKNFKASAGSDSTAWCEKVLEIPQQKSIYVGLQGHDMHVVLTEWGFHQNVFQPDKGVIKKLIEKSPVSLVVKVVSDAGAPQKNHKVNISGLEENQEHVTNNEGIVGLPSIPAGEQLKISSGPYPHISKNYESKPFGLVRLVVPADAPSPPEVDDLKEKVVDPPIIQKKESANDPVEGGIRLVNNKNKPIKNHKVFISEADIDNEKPKQYLSDKSGLLKNVKMDPNKSYKVKTRYRLSKWEGVVKRGSSSSFSSIKVPFVFPWMWALIGTFLILFWFLPIIPVGHKYVVVDASGGRVEDIEVESYLTGRDTKIIYSDDTDSAGVASFSLGRVSLFRYAIWPKDAVGEADEIKVKSTKAPLVSPVDTICVGNNY